MVNTPPLIMLGVVMNRISGLNNVWTNSDFGLVLHSPRDCPRLLLPHTLPVKLLKMHWTKIIERKKGCRNFSLNNFIISPVGGHKYTAISGHGCIKYIVIQNHLLLSYTLSFSCLLLSCHMLNFSHCKQPAFGCDPHTNV